MKQSYLLYLILVCLSLFGCNQALKQSIETNTHYYATMAQALDVAKSDLIEMARLSKQTKSYDTTKLKLAKPLPHFIAPLDVLQKEIGNSNQLQQIFTGKHRMVYVPFIFNHQIISSAELSYSKKGWQILRTHHTALNADMKRLIGFNPEIITPVEVYATANFSDKYVLSFIPGVYLSPDNDSLNVYQLQPIISKNNFAQFTIDSIAPAVKLFSEIYAKGLSQLSNNTPIQLPEGYYFYMNGMLQLVNNPQRKKMLDDFIQQQIQRLSENKRRTTH